MMSSAQVPLITPEKAVAALTALGLIDAFDEGPKDLPFLLGALLAAVEAVSYRTLDRAALPVAHEGYMSMLFALSGNEPDRLARAWSAVLNDRLNRTAVELQEATEGNGRMFIDVAGPAMLVAANLLNVLNHGGMTEDIMRDTLATADGNLKTARRNLGHLREQLRKEGFKTI